MAGKGSKPRKMLVDRKVYELRHTLLWGTEVEKKEARKKLIEMGVIKDG